MKPAVAGITIYQSLEGIKHSILMSVFGYHSTCKHSPTCSQYASAEIKKNGTITGLYRGLKRILTCW